MAQPQFERDPAEGGLDVVEHELARQAQPLPVMAEKRGGRGFGLAAELLVLSIAAVALILIWRRRPTA
ncbi:hypothetical protein NO932_14635 [Pelagibacterium sp. 26DY04]|uniref:hypothetical protein n=1 Tax=Pelagibacterium sp. 26DY04 TaxID=2967130 RepID=UPI002814D9FA|nr:hypothetical protein [Pelagibacterium sp. 26DY04]WMT86148.1 hypothetical protein NO932_14635 [Pelagibacterium sp. 26DY04]